MELTLIVNNVKSVARARSHRNEIPQTRSSAPCPSNPVRGDEESVARATVLQVWKFCRPAQLMAKGSSLIPQTRSSFVTEQHAGRSLDSGRSLLKIATKPSKSNPNIKALLRRADSNAKLERWVESVRDYKVLSEEIPGDTVVAEALFHAVVALKISRGGVSNLKFGIEVEDVTSLKQFQAAICLSATSVIYFMATSNLQCSHISPLVDSLCACYPTTNFLKVDINKSPAVAKSESMRVVPTIKIYKNGIRIKEMICPSQQVLEYSVGHYSQG